MLHLTVTGKFWWLTRWQNFWHGQIESANHIKGVSALVLPPRLETFPSTPMKFSVATRGRNIEEKAFCQAVFCDFGHASLTGRETMSLAKNICSVKFWSMTISHFTLPHTPHNKSAGCCLIMVTSFNHHGKLSWEISLIWQCTCSSREYF